MPTIDWVATFVSSVISGLIGITISTYFYRRYERRQMKLKTLKDFAANRYDILGEDFTKALNEVFVVYNDSPNVRNTLKRFHENRVAGISSSDLADQYFVELFKAMCDDTGVKYTDFTDNFFLRPFNAKRG